MNSPSNDPVHKHHSSEHLSSKPSECKALLDACTPEVYINNTFRITGLAVDATTREVKRRIEELKADDEAGHEAEQTHAFALTTSPKLEQLRAAAQRLHEPECRIIDEFFWFWPYEWGKGHSDPALLMIQKGEDKQAYKIWTKSLADTEDVACSIVAKHNLAVMAHIRALDAELVSLQNDHSPEELELISKYWRMCFKWWEELSDNEMFWDLVAQRIHILKDPHLTTGFVRRMRYTFPEALDKINAMLAIRFIDKNKIALANKQIEYIHQTNKGKDNVPKTLSLVAGPLQARIKDAVENARAVIKHKPATADKTASELIEIVSAPIRTLKLLLSDSYEFIDLSDSVAATCLECRRVFIRETKNWEASKSIIEQAFIFACTDEIKKELEQDWEIIKKNIALESPEFKKVMLRLGEIEGKEINNIDSYWARIKHIYNDMPELLSALAAATEGKESSLAYQICSDAVSRSLRHISVEMYNTLNASTSKETLQMVLAVSLQIHDRAARLACSAEAKAVFQKDEAELGETRNSVASNEQDLIDKGLLPEWGKKREKPGKRVGGKTERPTNQNSATIKSTPLDGNTTPLFKRIGAWGWILIAYGLLKVLSCNSATSRLPAETPQAQQQVANTPSAKVPVTQKGTDDNVNVGKYSCSSYHARQADLLKPDAGLGRKISNLQSDIEKRLRRYKALKNEIENTTVDNYDQNSVDAYNNMVNDYNNEGENIKAMGLALDPQVNEFNGQVDVFNNYLRANCTERR